MLKSKLNTRIRIQCDITDKIEDLFNQGSSRTTEAYLEISNSSYRPSIEPTDLPILVKCNGATVGTIHMSLYTGYVDKATAWGFNGDNIDGLIDANPMSSVSTSATAIRKLFESLEGEPMDGEIFQIARGLFTGSIIRVPSKH